MAHVRWWHTATSESGWLSCLRARAGETATYLPQALKSKSMAYFLVACQVFLSVLLFISSISKFSNLKEFNKILRLSRIPEALIHPLTITIPFIELLCAIILIFSDGYLLFIALIVTMAIFVIFTVWLIWVYVQKLYISCGCFGTNSKAVGLSAIIRNIILIFVAASGTVIASYQYNIFNFAVNIKGDISNLSLILMIFGFISVVLVAKWFYSLLKNYLQVVK